jgi:heat shock protein HtpX
MWELIRANQRKSFWLFVCMGILLLLLGYAIGGSLIPDGGGSFGVVIALGIWIILSIISIAFGSNILLAISGAKEVTQDVHPQLFNVVEEMKIAAGLPKIPKIYIINEEAPNAFATGIKPENSAIAVTAGLLSKLNRDELQGVVAHETGHIFNRDIRFMTMAGIMLGSIVLISEIYFRGMWITGGGRRYSSKSSKSSGQGQLIIMIAAIALAILAPILARLLYLAISRKREYLADATAVRFTRYPEGLASALEKISESHLDLPSANKVTAPMYIVNPLKEKGMKIADLTSTHPPISERVRILRSISQGANFIDYQNAFDKIKRKASPILPPSALTNQEKVEIRKPGEVIPVDKTAKQNKRTLGDLMMTVNNYSFINCVCGMKIKVPAGFGTNKPQVTCPRCGHVSNVVTNKII